MRETGAGKRGLLASPQAGRGQTRRACTQPWWIRSRRASRSFGSALCCDSDGEHIAWKRLALVPALRKCSRNSGGATWGQGCQRRTLAVSQDTDRCNTGTASSREERDRPYFSRCVSGGRAAATECPPLQLPPWGWNGAASSRGSALGLIGVTVRQLRCHPSLHSRDTIRPGGPTRSSADVSVPRLRYDERPGFP